MGGLFRLSRDLTIARSVSRVTTLSSPAPPPIATAGMGDEPEEFDYVFGFGSISELPCSTSARFGAPRRPRLEVVVGAA